MTVKRQYSILDQLCLGVDQALRTLTNQPRTSGRVYPAELFSEPLLTTSQRQHAAALMRINHAGEVCAQALYHGQGIASKDRAVREKMQHAAIEEGDHLAWCSKRLTELGSHTSYLNPFWYASSFIIGLTAGVIGDKWSLGFLAETEQQVVEHLQNQLCLLPKEDIKSHSILQQMQHDEAQHHEDAIQAGAAELPFFIKKWMNFSSKIMVRLAYWF